MENARRVKSLMMTPVSDVRIIRICPLNTPIELITACLAYKPMKKPPVFARIKATDRYSLVASGHFIQYSLDQRIDSIQQWWKSGKRWT